MEASHSTPQRSHVERARAGDSGAFDRLVGCRIDRLYATARLIVRDPDGAQDAVQEALVRAWRDLPALRDPDRFDAWLHRLLVRACADEGRRRRRWRLEVHVAVVEPSVDDRAFAAIADKDELERAFRHLSEAHRVVLALQHVLGLSTAETAAAIGIPTGTVKSRTHFALSALKAGLATEARRIPDLRRAEETP
jgi:RNA polymerase sigma-70 factor, ECF subfamily